MAEQTAEKMLPKRICYVDDSRTSAFVTRKMLERKGYEVEHFVLADVALEALMDKHFDLLITDLMITTEGDGVNGDDLIRLVRFCGHPSVSLIPIIVVTGTASEDTQKELVATGASRVLIKPIDEDILEKAITDTLSDSPQGSGAPQSDVARPAPTPPEIIVDEPPLFEDKTPAFKNEPSEPVSQSTFKHSTQSADNISLKDQLASQVKKQEEALIPTLTEEVSVPEPETKDEDKGKINPDISTKFDRQDIRPHNSVVDIPMVDEIQIEPVAPPPQSKPPAPSPKPAPKQETRQKPAAKLSKSNKGYDANKLSLEPIEGDEHNAAHKDNIFLKDEVDRRPDTSHFGIDLESMFPSDPSTPQAPAPKIAEPEPPAEANTKAEFVTESDFDVDSFFLDSGNKKSDSEKEDEQKPKPDIDKPKFEDLAAIREIETATDDSFKTTDEEVAEPEWLNTENTEPKKNAEENPLLSLLDQFDEEQEKKGFNTSAEAPFKRPGLKLNVTLSPKARNTILGGFAAVLFLPALFYFIFQETLLDVDFVTVQMEPIHEAVSVSGRVVSKKEIEITSFFPGQLKSVKVKEGVQVKKGQVLAVLDGREGRSRVTRAEAKLLSIQEKVALSHKSLERLQKALDKGAVSRQMVEDVEAKWKTESAKQSLAEEELKEARLHVERLKIKAPFSGLVSSLDTQEGQWLAPPEPLLKLVDMTNIEVELRVDAADSANLLAGQKVDVSSDAFPGQTWEEEIIRIASTTQREKSSNFINVFVTLGDKAPRLKVGQQVDASVKIASNNRALVIPFEAIKQINGQTMVAVDLNGRVHYVPVVTGIESFSKVEVVQGLTIGQRILLPGGLNLEEGQKITIVE